MNSSEPTLEPYLYSIQHAYPDFSITSARFVADAGQNNIVLALNETFIFRFPKYEVNLQQLQIELAVLTGIHNFITLPIPQPSFTHLDAPAGGQAFMGYRMLPGDHLWRETLAAIHDDAVLDRLASQLAGFLKALHSVPAHEAITCELPREDTMEGCADIYRRVQRLCFPHMRPDARAWATAHFENFLSDPRHFDYAPVLKHSDFGMGNILFDAAAQEISGIIDFGSACLGDPAYDFAGLLSSYGEAFVQRMERFYPALASYWERIYFYRGTFALLEALFGLEQGDEAAFRDGIEQYR